MIHIAQGWQLGVERGPGWLFVRPYNLTQSDEALASAEEGLALQGIGLANSVPLAEHPALGGDTLLESADVEVELADQVWHLLEQNFTRRVVLELDQISCLTSHLIGQLMALQERVVGEGGLMRICGLSAANEAVLSQCGLLSRFTCYGTRPDAVMGYRPPRPR